MTDPRDAYLGLPSGEGLGPVRLRRLLERLGDVAAAWDAPPGDLLGAGLEPKAIESLLVTRRAFDPAAFRARLGIPGRDRAHLGRRGLPGAPARGGRRPARALRARRAIPADDWAVGVVGTRQVTSYGREVTARLAADLARSAVTVVSGLARGVDTLAHTAALDAGGSTIAVLGSGVDQIPAGECGLVRRIVEEAAAPSSRTTRRAHGPTQSTSRRATVSSPDSASACSWEAGPAAVP